MFPFPVVLQGSPSPQMFFWLRESFSNWAGSRSCQWDICLPGFCFSKPSALTGLCWALLRTIQGRDFFPLDQGREAGFMWWLHLGPAPTHDADAKSKGMLFKEVGGQANEDVRAPWETGHQEVLIFWILEWPYAKRKDGWTTDWQERACNCISFNLSENT